MKMRYSTEPNFRKYVKGYVFLSFPRKRADKYGKKLMDIATKTGIDAAKTPSKRVVQKTTEATGDLIRNKIADKITSLGKTKSKEKEKEEEKQEIYKPAEKRQQITDDLNIICINWVPGDPRTIFLVTSFTGKMPESSDSMYSSIFMLENI